MRSIICFFSLIIIPFEVDGQKLMGVTSSGGNKNSGVVYSVDWKGDNFLKIKDFETPTIPGSGELVLGDNNFLFGLSGNGGDFNYGTIFKVKNDGTNFSIIKSFDKINGANPYSGTLIIGSDGKLYGVTEKGGSANGGVIFKLNQDGSGFTKLKDFDANSGIEPMGSLLEVSSTGKLYGVTYRTPTDGGGKIYRIDKDGSNFETIHSFTLQSIDGSNPLAGLTEHSDGFLYGVTRNGGTGGSGTFYKIDSEGNFTLLFSFPSEGFANSKLLSGDASTLYGYNSNYLYKINPNGSGFSKIMAGDFFLTKGAPQLDSQGFLNGVVTNQSQSDKGFIFKIRPDGSGFQKEHLFLGSGAATSWNQFIKDANSDNFYGTTFMGGNNDSGVIYKFSVAGFSILYQFNPDGKEFYPIGNLAKGDTHVYGLTKFGGKGCGVLYQIDLSNYQYSKIYTFESSLGCRPTAVSIDANGTLWGATGGGGSSNAGVIFKFDKSSGYSKVVDLDNSKGFDITDEFSFYEDYMYGISSGTVFKVNKSNGEFVKLLDLDPATTGGGGSGLIAIADGLFGTTYFGGSANKGTIFKINRDGTGLKILSNFDSYLNNGPSGGLTYDNGFLFGLAANGNSIYRVKADGTDFKNLHTFGNFSAAFYGNLEIANNELYGTQSGQGSIFKMKLDGSDFKNLFSSFNEINGLNPLSGTIPIDFDLITSTDIIDQKSNISVYPTLSEGYFYVNSSKHIESTSIEVYNFLGNKIDFSFEKISPTLIRLSFSVPPSIYIVKIKDGISQSTHKIINK